MRTETTLSRRRKRALSAVCAGHVERASAEEWELGDQYFDVRPSLLRNLMTEGLIEPSPKSVGRWIAIRLTDQGRRALELADG